MKSLIGFICIVYVCVTSIALAQTTKSRHNVDANKKWELLHDATGQVLASCDASLKCEVSERLKQMIACHDKMRAAIDHNDADATMVRSIMQECVTAWTDR